MPSEKQVDLDMDLPFLVRKLRTRLEGGALAIEKKLIGVPREALKLVDLLPPLLVPTVLLVLRKVLGVRVAKIAPVTKLQGLIHRDQMRGIQRQLLENSAKKANLVLFLELTLLPHRLQEKSKRKN
jgi:hypothetical protein